METTSRSVRLGARQARLEAEKEGGDFLWFAAELKTREASDPAVAPLREGERKLFSLRLPAPIRHCRSCMNSQARVHHSF